MSSKKVILIVGLSLVALALLLSTLFKFKKVPQAKWNKNYEFKSKEPYGGWMFEQMLKERFEDVPIKLNHKETDLSFLDTCNALYIKIGNKFPLLSRDKGVIDTFIMKGNDALLIGASTSYENDYKYAWPPDEVFSFSDSILHIKIEDGAFNDTFNYKHYLEEFTVPKKSFYRGIHIEKGDLYNRKVLAVARDSYAIFLHEKVDTGELAFITIPELFSNQAAKQEGYLQFFNFVFKDKNPDFIILDHPSFGGYNYLDSEIESPIEFVLENPPLRWAYFLLLATALLYVLFKSKRKQRYIPTIQKNENTSLEYVQTLSKLFSLQDQNDKLVPHIKRHFYHKIKAKYFIDEKNPDFILLLSKKSKVEQKEIMSIVNMLKNAGTHYEFNDEQLINLYKRLEKFYKNAK